MGKGDKKTKRGKIIIGSYGVKRRKKKSPSYFPPVEKVAKPKPQLEKVVEEEAEVKKVKKTAAKKTTAKKPEKAPDKKDTKEE